MQELPIYERDNSGRDKKWKFDFDTMDTLRYWYDNLAELFSCTQEEIATACNYFIAEFGITNDCVKEWRQKYLLNND